MFLSKHKNGYYYIYFIDPITEKRHAITTKQKIKKEALNFLTNFKKSVEEKKINKTIPITLKKFIFEYLKYSETVHSVNTTKTVKTTLTNFLRYNKDVQISTITTARIQDYLEIRIRTSSKYQARKDLINLSSAFNKAVLQKYLINNPCRSIKRIKVPEKQPLFFSEEELKKLLEVIQSKDLRDIILFAINTGLRQMELITLQWDQINFKDNLLRLDNRNHLTKSKKVRAIPLNLTSLQILTERELIKTNSYVFTNSGKIFNPILLSKEFKFYVIKAEINKELHFHSLRHTFASWLVQKGVSIYQVSKLLGHADIKTTQIYSHLRADDLQNTVNLLNNITK
ncbi:MAG: site-specific integrase [Ignavibacteriales bacterium]|nr:site-specific integrase [Ignavibacteriales bacterium]